MTDTPDVQKIAAEAIITEIKKYVRPVPDFGGTVGWGANEYDLADAVLSAVEPVIRRKVEDDMEPCRLDHGCELDEMCGCWCDFHDCPLEECPSYKLVTAWLEQARQDERRQVAAAIEAHIEKHDDGGQEFAGMQTAAAIARSHDLASNGGAKQEGTQ